VHRVEKAEAARGDQRLAAAAAAVADEIDLPADVFPELDKVAFVGLSQQIQPLGDFHPAGEAVADQRSGRVAEGHADLLRRGAVPAEMLHLVTAVADPHRPVGGAPDHLARPLVIQHVKGVFRGQGRFVHENPPQLRLPFREEVPDEILLHVQVLVEELAEELLIDVVPDPHHGKFEKAGHRGRQEVGLVPLVVFHVQKEGAAGQRIERFLGLLKRNFPDVGRLSGCEGLDRQ